MKLGMYQHYKGAYYEVLGISLHTETQEKMVLYRALYPCLDLAKEYGEDPLFVRPYAMFCGDVETNGQSTPRFKYIKSMNISKIS